MEPNEINNINDNEPIEETEIVEEIDVEAIEAEDIGERRHRRGRGRHGRRPFGPNRPYRFALFAEEDGTYVLRSPDLADGTVQVTSLDAIGDTMRAAIADRAAEDAVAAAEAEKDAQFSGKFVLRLPHSMHRQLSELAEAEGVSLNQLALIFLAQGMGRAHAIEEFGKRRGPKGGHRGPGKHGPKGGRGRHGDHGPEGRDPDGRDFERRGPKVHGFGPRHPREGGPDNRFGGRGFGRGMGRGHRRPEFTGSDADGPRLV